MSWKEKTCEQCKYRTVLVCRRFPPITTEINNVTRTAHPLVIISGTYIPACAEYTEEGQASAPTYEAALAVFNTPVIRGVRDDV